MSEPAERPRSDRLSEVLRTLLLRPHRRTPATTQRGRLDHLEEDLREVRTRVNALFFTVIAVGLGDLLGQVMIS